MKAAVWSVVVAMAMILGGRATAAGQPAPADLSATPALAEAEQKIRTELALTPDQEARARALITERLGKAEQIVESFGDVSLDSVIDLLSEARAIKKEFIPQITSLLTPEQRARLAKLPKSEDLWTNVTSAWMAEARLKKLAARIRLTPAQVPEVRAALLGQFHDAADIIDGLFRTTNGQPPGKQAVMDAVLDLRSAIRAGQRRIDRLLTPEQRAALQAYKADSERASQAKSTP
jgi:Spy/CpxP family protein refolding chaperone